jgi:hypothetical protein
MVGKSSPAITFAPNDQIVLISTFPTPVSGRTVGVFGWLLIICCCFPSSGAVAHPIVGSAFMLVAPNGQEIQPILGVTVGGVITGAFTFIEGACDCIG